MTLPYIHLSSFSFCLLSSLFSFHLPHLFFTIQGLASKKTGVYIRKISYQHTHVLNPDSDGSREGSQMHSVSQGSQHHFYSCCVGNPCPQSWNLSILSSSSLKPYTLYKGWRRAWYLSRCPNPLHTPLFFLSFTLFLNMTILLEAMASSIRSRGSDFQICFSEKHVTTQLNHSAQG